MKFINTTIHYDKHYNSYKCQIIDILIHRYIIVIKHDDTGVETTGELETPMLDRMKSRRVIQDPRAAPADPP